MSGASTTDAIVIDDMEGYRDQEFLEAWTTWIDGFDDPSNGALVGNGATGSPEYDRVHAGVQSLPITYDNSTAAQSEATRTFALAQDWTRGGATQLLVWFYGAAGNTGQLYLKINGTKIPAGPSATIGLAGWRAWSTDLGSLAMNLQSVRSLAMGVEGNGAIGTLYIDDIALVVADPEPITEWLSPAGSDDAEEHVLDGGIMETLISTDLELGHEGTASPASQQIVGIRWVGIGIPKGATITEAWVQFSADDINNGYHALPVSQVIEGELGSTPETFSGVSGSISSRAATNTQVVWDIPRWTTVHLRGPGERTPDLSSIIQELVNQPDWSGEAIVLMFSDQRQLFLPFKDN